MKVYQIAITILILSSVATLFNELHLLPVDIFSPGAVVNTDTIDQSMDVDVSGGTIETSSSIVDMVSDIGGGLIDFVMVILKTLQLALTLGSVFSYYFPGPVGAALSVMIYGITYTIYGWGGMQLYRKVSTKGMD